MEKRKSAVQQTNPATGGNATNPPSIYDSLPDILTCPKIAEYLHIDSTTVYNWIRAGKLPAYRLGTLNSQPTKRSSVRVNKNDFIEFMERSRS